MLLVAKPGTINVVMFLFCNWSCPVEATIAIILTIGCLFWRLLNIHVHYPVVKTSMKWMPLQKLLPLPCRLIYLTLVDGIISRHTYLGFGFEWIHEVSIHAANTGPVLEHIPFGQVRFMLERYLYTFWFEPKFVTTTPITLPTDLWQQKRTNVELKSYWL